MYKFVRQTNLDIKIFLTQNESALNSLDLLIIRMRLRKFANFHLTVTLADFGDNRTLLQLS